MVATASLAVVARPDFPASDVKELIAVAKADPNKVVFASPGFAATQGVSAIDRRAQGRTGIDVPTSAGQLEETGQGHPDSTGDGVPHRSIESTAVVGNLGDDGVHGVRRDLRQPFAQDVQHLGGQREGPAVIERERADGRRHLSSPNNSRARVHAVRS